MAKRKVGRPKQSNNNTGAQLGANLTGVTVSSQSRELETSSVTDHDTTTTPPPAGGGSQTGAQESPVQVTSNLSTMSYHLIKARAKQCPTTLHKEDQGMTLLENGKECLVSQDEMKVMITCNHAQYVARRSDDEDTWDELASEVKKVAESSAEAMRKTQASLSSLNQCINALRKKYQGQAETSRS